MNKNNKLGIKMFFVTLVAILLLPNYLLANDGSNVDIIPRTINFVIFFAIMFWFLKPKISDFFNSRVDEIEKSLEDAKKASEKSKSEFLKIKKELANVQKLAQKQKDEALKQAKEIANQLAEDKKTIQAQQNKNLEVKKEAAQNKLYKEAVEEFLENNISMDKIGLKDDKITSILLKKAI